MIGTIVICLVAGFIVGLFGWMIWQDVKPEPRPEPTYERRNALRNLDLRPPAGTLTVNEIRQQLGQRPRPYYAIDHLPYPRPTQLTEAQRRAFEQLRREARRAGPAETDEQYRRRIIADYHRPVHINVNTARYDIREFAEQVKGYMDPEFIEQKENLQEIKELDKQNYDID